MSKVLPKDYFQNIVSKLGSNLEIDEKQSITYLLLGYVFDLSRTDFILNQSFNQTLAQEKIVSESVERLLNHEPIQYVFNETEFFGRNFYVDKSVLIPRQETELLIQLLTQIKTWDSPAILDIGTGSGCIACSLKLEIENSRVAAYDISDTALEVAKKNAMDLGCTIEFSKVDILNEDIKESNFDLIVSNPPYVTNAEKTEMKTNVLENEPHLALFVSDDDPLVFYDTIMEKGKQVLKKNGLLFFEINEQFGKETLELFEAHEFSEPNLYDDIHGKHRFASAKWT